MLNDVLMVLWSSLLQPNLAWLIPALVLAILLVAPLPGRGPATRRRDPWRSFKFGTRRELMARAGDQCEAPGLLVWGRCPEPATDADHVYPWAKGGPTVFSNGQALCRSHNVSKSSATPPWWYLRGLERRRAQYFPAGADVRVFARMSEQDALARERTKARTQRP